MNKLKNSGDTLKTNSSWDALKDVKFAGESSNKHKTSYNEKYITDFGRDKLREILGNKETLKTIGNDYINQYRPDSQSKATNLARKESLDHFVLERLSSEHPEMFLESQEFKNYAEYIINTANNKHFNSTDNRYTVYPEFITNPVLRNKKARDLVLKAAIPNGDPEKMNAWVKQNREWYKEEVLGSAKKMEERKQIGQRDFEIVGDYLYSSKRFDTGTAKTFAEYCFNNIKPDYNLKPTTPILGALTNYFATQYTIDDDVKKNSRFFIANNIRGEKDFGTGGSSNFGCVLNQNRFSKISLTADDSLNKSRTYITDDNNCDLYYLMMVSFHELTHSHQNNMVRKGNKSSTAIMYIMRDILNEGSGCYIAKKKDGSEMKWNYYKANHDNDEIEIEADEEAWRQCREFLAKHQNNYSSDETQRKINHHRLKQCEENVEEVKGRRGINHKLANNLEVVSAIKYDIEILKTTIKKKPDLLKTYPQLADYIDSSGNLRPDIFTSSKLASGTFANESPREDVFGNEIGTYMLNDNQEFNRLAKYVFDNRKSLTTSQINTLTFNLENIIHHTIAKARRLDKVDFANYDETDALGKNINVQKRKADMTKQYLMQAYRSVLLLDMVGQSHPELSEEISHQELAHIDGNYYFELSRDKKKDAKTNEIHYELSKDRKLDIVFVKQAVEAYKKTNNPILLNIAGQLRNDYGLQ